VNRWRRRLAELHDDTDEQRSVLSRAVQIVQNVQNPRVDPASEHFEQIEQWTEPPATPLARERALTTWGEFEEECAAIVEHDGNIPRAWAEGFARMHPDRPPDDVPLRRWQQFVDDVGRFLDSSFCAVAAALGWGPLDLFGCDRDRLFPHTDPCGLLWHLNGDRLIALSENTATIERRTGARQAYRRKPADPGRVLAWELADGGH
jgi:hypothetical protein